jgi:endonuclease-8
MRTRTASALAGTHDEGMPEGDAVRRTALRLDAALAGRVLTASDVRVPRFATLDLRGQQVVGTHAVGKHLLTRTDAGLTIHSHRRMEGRWVTGPADLRAGPRHQIRVELRTADSAAIGLRLAMVEVARTSDEKRWVGHLGPDILAEDFDPALPLPTDRPAVEMLLDQRVIAGLGTMWACETAFAARVSPYACAGDLAAALARTRQQMLAGVHGARPRMQVFERTGQPCRVCGTTIREGRVGRPPKDRVTYWCPACQAG